MSYKQNQEKMTVSATGKVDSAITADTASRITQDVYVNQQTSAGDPNNYGSIPRPGTYGTSIYPTNTTVLGTSSSGGLIIQNKAGYDENYDHETTVGLGSQNYFENTVAYLSFTGGYVSQLYLRSGNIPGYNGGNGLNIAWFLGGAPYASKIGGGAWGTLSDERLKQNIRPISSALEKLTALNPCHFEFKNVGENANPEGTRTGFIAQEFEQVLPGHTFEMEPMAEADKQLLGEGVKAKGIEADLVPYLVKAIQELKAELDTVKAELAVLKDGLSK
jgi:hypothetical protein